MKKYKPQERDPKDEGDLEVFATLREAIMKAEGKKQ